MGEKPASISVRWLETLCRVVELQSYTRAAEAVGLTQPAVSQQVRALERYFSAQLVIPAPRGVRTTEAGQKVYQMAARMESDIQRLRREFADAAHHSAGVVRIACGPTALCHYIPRLLRALWLAHPDISVRTTTLVGQLMTDAVVEGRADVAINSGAYLSSRLTATPCVDARIILVCSPEHPLADAEYVPAHELAAVKIGTLSFQSETGWLVQNWLVQQGVTLTQRVEFGATEAVRAAALSGLVAGFVSHYSVMEDLAAGRLRQVRIDGPATLRHMYALHQPEPGQAVRHLLAVVEALHRDPEFSA